MLLYIIWFIHRWHISLSLLDMQMILYDYATLPRGISSFIHVSIKSHQILSYSKSFISFMISAGRTNTKQLVQYRKQISYFVIFELIFIKQECEYNSFLMMGFGILKTLSSDVTLFLILIEKGNKTGEASTFCIRCSVSLWQLLQYSLLFKVSTFTCSSYRL